MRNPLEQNWITHIPLLDLCPICHWRNTFFFLFPPSPSSFSTLRTCLSRTRCLASVDSLHHDRRKADPLVLIVCSTDQARSLVLIVCSTDQARSARPQTCRRSSHRAGHWSHLYRWAYVVDHRPRFPFFFSYWLANRSSHADDRGAHLIPFSLAGLHFFQ